jgi:hypothetical protein
MAECLNVTETTTESNHMIHDYSDEEGIAYQSEKSLTMKERLHLLINQKLGNYPQRFIRNQNDKC